MGMVVAITVHEFAHAPSTWLCDQTAKKRWTAYAKSGGASKLGRLLMLLMAGFGWGKPVPYNPYNLRYQC